MLRYPMPTGATCIVCGNAQGTACPRHGDPDHFFFAHAQCGLTCHICGHLIRLGEPFDMVFADDTIAFHHDHCCPGGCPPPWEQTI
jgi:hypothetical protein